MKYDTIPSLKRGALDKIVNMDRGWYGTYTLYGKKID